MAISVTSLLSISFLLITSSLAHAQIEYVTERRLRGRNRCNIERITAQEPSHRVESEAGVTELFDENDQQFECAGVAFQRRIIQPRGLLPPSFFNAPRLVYILQGRGISGTVVPGCPESFQQFQQQSQRRRGQGQRSSDQHQRINHFREGDILALPAGVVHWAYNDGDQPVVAITVVDTGNNANQLDRNHRQFLLAGRKQRGQRFSVEPTRQEDSNENIFNGFETESLAEVMGISRDLAEKLKGRNDNRGEIIRVEEELRVIRPSRMEREEYEEERRRQTTVNGLEQAFCSLRIKENIDDPERADIYNPNAGRITHLNSKKLPILRYLQLNAEKGVVRPDALISPHWNVNAHAIVYISRGSARFQIVGLRGNTVHNNEVRQGQVVVVPQHFATLIRSSREGFEYVAFFTNDNAIVSNIVGKDSVLKGMPVEVIMNSYRMSTEEARRVKENRGEELALFEPRVQGRRYG
ncbi:glutelin type-A 1-like [Asparagus officinalis]|uniref:glutelin type-A 1-like n=1 Tax=Asparagus officinalis TaxID=4686 RepID=UPI00098E57E1|nr:glutelin type-A 1-like [Asparagus officinalis]